MSKVELWRKLQDRLVETGYLTPSSKTEIRTEAGIPQALLDSLADVEREMGLTRKGLLTRPSDVDVTDVSDAIAYLTRPVCGVIDSRTDEGEIGLLSFGSSRGVWSRGALTYRLDSKRSSLGEPATTHAITAAFNMWGVVARPFFTFAPAPAGTRADINLSFGGRELDEDFGSQESVLASAQPPEYGGIFFDASEYWGNPPTASNPGSTAAARTQYLTVVALHEIGHALGLPHEDDPGRIMSPSLSLGTVPNIDPSAVDQLTLLYKGWSPQYRLDQGATTDRPAMANTAILSFDGGTFSLNAAWKGTEGDSRIYTSELSAQGQWSLPAPVEGVATSTGPALLSYAPPGSAPNETGLLMAWKGAGDNNNIWWSTRKVFSKWAPQQANRNVGTSARPALCAIDDEVILAWKGSRDDQGLYWSSFDERGHGSWTNQAPVPGAGSSDGPAMAVLDNRLYLFWKGVAGDQRLWYSTFDRAARQWGIKQQVLCATEIVAGEGGPPVVTKMNPGSTAGPAATLRLNEIILSWKGVNGDNNIYFSLFDGDTGMGQMRLTDRATSNGPALMHHQGITHALWKGTRGDHAIYWSFL